MRDVRRLLTSNIAANPTLETPDSMLRCVGQLRRRRVRTGTHDHPRKPVRVAHCIAPDNRGRSDGRNRPL
jgi:hypothetical protein